MRVLHLSDRLTDRGGAHQYLLGVLEALAERGHEVVLAVGSVDEGLRAPCPVLIVPGLDALRDAVGRRPTAPEGFDRDRLMRRLVEVYESVDDES